MSCADYSWDDLVSDDRGYRDFAVGDLVWNPKDAGAHLLTGESEPMQFGWEKPWSHLICECGRIDMLDHHVFMLRRASRCPVCRRPVTDHAEGCAMTRPCRETCG